MIGKKKFSSNRISEFFLSLSYNSLEKKIKLFQELKNKLKVKNSWNIIKSTISSLLFNY
jgi:hypothetical protein